MTCRRGCGEPAAHRTRTVEPRDHVVRREVVARGETGERLDHDRSLVTVAADAVGPRSGSRAPCPTSRRRGPHSGAGPYDGTRRPSAPRPCGSSAPSPAPCPSLSTVVAPPAWLSPPSRTGWPLAAYAARSAPPSQHGGGGQDGQYPSVQCGHDSSFGSPWRAHLPCLRGSPAAAPWPKASSSSALVPQVTPACAPAAVRQNRAPRTAHHVGSIPTGGSQVETPADQCRQRMEKLTITVVVRPARGRMSPRRPAEGDPPSPADPPTAGEEYRERPDRGASEA